MKQRILIKYLLLSSLVLLYAVTSCISFKKPKPVPDDKKDFIGLWVAQNGFKMDIKASGTADITENKYTGNQINDTLNIGVTPEYAKNMLVEFSGDSLLIIHQPTVRCRQYHINKNPYQDGDTCKMVLNGVLLIKQK